VPPAGFIADLLRRYSKETNSPSIGRGASCKTSVTNAMRPCFAVTPFACVAASTIEAVLNPDNASCDRPGATTIPRSLVVRDVRYEQFGFDGPDEGYIPFTALILRERWVGYRRNTATTFVSDRTYAPVARARLRDA
jgi:hypothetical protein